jgi:hypothetical protein
VVVVEVVIEDSVVVSVPVGVEAVETTVDGLVEGKLGADVLTNFTSSDFGSNCKQRVNY